MLHPDDQLFYNVTVNEYISLIVNFYSYGTINIKTTFR